MAAIAALLLIGSAFLPWIHIDAINTTLTGYNDQGLSYGPRGRGHIYFGALILLLVLIGRNWSMLIAIVIAAVNLAFAGSHWYVYRCSAGVCPEKLLGLYLVMGASLLLLLFLLFSPVRPVKEEV